MIKVAINTFSSEIRIRMPSANCIWKVGVFRAPADGSPCKLNRRFANIWYARKVSSPNRIKLSMNSKTANTEHTYSFCWNVVSSSSWIPNHRHRFAIDGRRWWTAGTVGCRCLSEQILFGIKWHRWMGHVVRVVGELFHVWCGYKSFICARQVYPPPPLNFSFSENTPFECCRTKSVYFYKSFCTCRLLGREWVSVPCACFR